jgi:hypothetical protein
LRALSRLALGAAIILIAFQMRLAFSFWDDYYSGGCCSTVSHITRRLQAAPRKAPNDSAALTFSHCLGIARSHRVAPTKATLLSAHMSPAPRAVFKATITIGETPMPTLAPTSMPRRNLLLLWTPAPAPTARTTAMFQLPALYVDGPYIKQSNTKTPVWLNEVNIEEFRQRNPHIFSDLYNVQGLRIAISEKWNVNLIRVAVDPESVESTSHEIERLITFAE